MIATKYIIIICLILVAVFVYSFNLTRFLAFKIDDVFKWINKRWWDLMFKVNVFFNNGYVRFTLSVLLIGTLIWSLYYMFGVLN